MSRGGFKPGDSLGSLEPSDQNVSALQSDISHVYANETGARGLVSGGLNGLHLKPKRVDTMLWEVGEKVIKKNLLTGHQILSSASDAEPRS